MQVRVDETKACVSVRFDRPALQKPLDVPVKESALFGIEQFTGPVEVVKPGEVETPLKKQPKQKKAPTLASPPKYRTFQLIPYPSVKNENVHEFADAIADSYTEIYRRITATSLRDPDRVFFETKIEYDSFRTFVTTNADLCETLQQKSSMVWHHVTTQEADDQTTDIDRKTTACYDLRLRRPFFLSLKTDQRMQEKPLAQLLEIGRTMTDGDSILIQLGWQSSENNWARTAEKQREAFDEKRPNWWSKDRKLSTSSTMKTAYSGYDFVLRIAVTSEDDRRRARLARGVVAAMKQLNHDNELKERRVWWLHKKHWIQRMQQRKIRVPLRTAKRQIVTGHEIGQFCKLPQKALQQQHRQVIESVVKPELQLTDELFMKNVPAVTIGTVTDRGKERVARFPIAAYGDVEQKYVDDAFCLPEFIFGEMGSGKTGEAIHRAYSSICNGRTAFFFDTADGQAARELHDALPDDYPEEKLIHLDLTNKAWPLMLSWLFSAKKASGGEEDDELELEKARETAKMFLKEFVSGMATSEFTDRMEQYLASASRAAGANPLDIELALTSPAFREELLERPEVQEQLDVVTDLLALQDKARRGSESSSVSGITSRLRILSADRFRTNLFYQQNGTPLEFRRYADNPEGGYGYCVTIYCDKNSFGAKGQEAILTFMLLKILLEAGYSRVDIDQLTRKVFEIEIDEGHRFLRGELAQQIGQDAAVELRKYRVKLNLFGHSREQLGKLWEAFESGGIQVTMYKSKNVKAFKDMANIIAPLDPEEAWASLGKHEAVVTRKLPSKQEVSFICKMAAPPKFVKDRSARREACARQFGRHWKKVSSEIAEKRREFAEKDRLWYDWQAEIVEQQKEAKRESRKRQKAS